MKEQGTRNKEQWEKKKTVTSVVTVLLSLDQTMKYFFSASERYYCNPDGPWGMPAGNGLWIVIMTILLAGAGYFSWKAEKRVLVAAFSLIIAGGLSNLVDRIVFGCVRDLALVSWFPAFNPADVYLTIGAVMAVSIFLSRNIRSRRSE